MRPENVQNAYEYSEAAEDASPSASVSEIMNRETSTGKLWPFLGGIVIGAAGVIAAALVADVLTYGEGNASGQPDSAEKKMLALPEGGTGA